MQNCNSKIKISKFSKFVFTIFVFGFCLSVLNISQVFAQTQNTDLEYTLLAPLPCVDGSGSGENFNPNCGQTAQKTTLEKYLPGMFQLLIGIAAAFAVFMIVIGGFQYMTTDAVQGKSEGKERIKNAIFGLVLVIGAWLILYTINPDLLKLRLSIEPADIKAPPTIGAARGTATLAADEARIRAVLADPRNGITVNADPCTGTQTTGCTTLAGLAVTTLDGVISLKRDCGCSIQITGGTEGGHSLTGGHGAGTALDLSTNTQLDNYIITNGGTPIQTALGPVYTVSVGGNSVRFLRESNPNHWHANF
jgi:hypothetical protein